MEEILSSSSYGSSKPEEHCKQAVAPPNTANGCTLCPIQCAAQRTGGEQGFCGAGALPKVARAALHFWEEPCLSGERGSGTVFFSGCPLKCIFCQNREISAGNLGQEITLEQLAAIFLDLQQQGAHNINLVTPTQYVPDIVQAVMVARRQGLHLPIVYNSSGYETVATLKQLQGIVDIYLPDFKYWDNQVALHYSGVTNYRAVACLALDEMFAQVGDCIFDEEGILQKGVLVRHLILPENTADSKAVVEYLHTHYGDRLYISLMSQYTPVGAPFAFPALNRILTPREYDDVVDFALALGIENGFLQEGESAQESFIPPFCKS